MEKFHDYQIIDVTPHDVIATVVMDTGLSSQSAKAIVSVRTTLAQGDPKVWPSEFIIVTSYFVIHQLP